MQVKLLRVLQESEIEGVGGIRTIKVDVRLIAATNSDLRKEIAQGNFRDDLYYRLNVVPIALPALRERRSDIPLLVGDFVAKFNARLKKNITGIDEPALEQLVAYKWPGNIRELENVIERAVLFANGPSLALADLTEDVRAAKTPVPPPAVPLGADGLKEQVRAAMVVLERDLIERALMQTQGNVTHAARLLKISRKGLQLKMKELGLRDREQE
jgi:DNA-binding NtrC family response regulator